MRTFIAVTAALAFCLAAGAFAQTYTVLHDFADGPTNGRDPAGGVMTDGSKFYGVTFRGGANDQGTLYSMNMDGSGYTVLRSFGPPPDGINPNSIPLLNGDILYGTAQSGGTFGRGTIYKIKTDGTVYDSRSFNVSPDGSRPCGPLTMSSDTIYGMCEDGGAFPDNKGTAFSIKTNGTGYTVLHGFAGSPSDGEDPKAGFFLDGGVLYGTTNTGGAYLSDEGTVFSMAPDGSNEKILHSFSFGDGAGASSTLISDGSRLYGTTEVGGSGTSLLFYGGGTVFAVDTDGSNFQTLSNLDFASGGMPGDVVQDGERLFGFAAHGGGGALFNGGVVFTLNIDGTGYTTLRQFDNLYQGTGAFPVGTPLLLNGTLYGITENGGANGEGVVFSYVIPTPPLQVTLNTIFPAAGQAWTVDAAVQPLAQRFDAWAVIQAPDGSFFSMVLGQPGRLIPGAVPLARNVPGLPAAITEQLLSMTLPPGLAAGAYTVTVALLPAGSPPALGNAIAGYGVQRIATIR